MKFAAFTTVAGSAGEATNSEQMIDNLRQQTMLAEELGFETMWLGEHHFGPSTTAAATTGGGNASPATARTTSRGGGGEVVRSSRGLGNPAPADA